MNKKDLIKFIAAFTYGDGHLSKHGNECRFTASVISDNRDYSEWRANILRNITGVKTTDMVDPRPNRKPFIKVNTQTHPMFTLVHSRLYLNGRKVIDPHYLKLLDWETLAILYMDDGSLRDVTQVYKSTQYHNYYPNIATNNFSYGDNYLLKKAIKENLGIEFNINKHSINKNGEQTYLLCLTGNSRQRFIENITPFILPSFEYKIRMIGSSTEDEDIVRPIEKSIEISRND